MSASRWGAGSRPSAVRTCSATTRVHASSSTSRVRGRRAQLQVLLGAARAGAAGTPRGARRRPPCGAPSQQPGGEAAAAPSKAPGSRQTLRKTSCRTSSARASSARMRRASAKAGRRKRRRDRRRRHGPRRGCVARGPRRRESSAGRRAGRLTAPIVTRSVRQRPASGSVSASPDVPIAGERGRPAEVVTTVSTRRHQWASRSLLS